jgi:hypothetical protein
MTTNPQQQLTKFLLIDRYVNPTKIRFDWRQIRRWSFWSIVLIEGILIITQTTRAIAQQPPLPSSLRVDRHKYREYIFTKPISANPDTNSIYLVEVYGDSNFLLYQVKKIEPQAFRKDGFIQVGKFRQQQSAEALVKQLNQAGLRSRITAN